MKVSVIIGTRPEAIKLAPVVLELRKDSSFECHVCSTGQHRQMLDQVLSIFGITPDVDLDLMVPNQTLGGLTARAIKAIDEYLATERPDLVLIQGDTTTVFCAALAAFYHKIPVGHVEAGLRTGNLQSPWPEEANRVLVSRLAAFHFAPTESNRQNLLREGVPDNLIFVTGNTVIDALLFTLEKAKTTPPNIQNLPGYLQPGRIGPRVVLITGHRRESIGQGFENICRAIGRLASDFPDVHFVYPVHLNPNVRQAVDKHLRTGPNDGASKPSISTNVHLIEPLGYMPFVALMGRAHIILTDSGGVQEEAPSLGKPVLLMRDTTERPEAVLAGTVKIVGTGEDAIYREAHRLLTDSKAHQSMQLAHNPYGDGVASRRICSLLKNY
jgi:UDP-N-acetylglucosamine 2-epimerase (non-hydrolysing)